MDVREQKNKPKILLKDGKIEEMSDRIVNPFG